MTYFGEVQARCSAVLRLVMVAPNFWLNMNYQSLYKKNHPEFYPLYSFVLK